MIRELFSRLFRRTPTAVWEIPVSNEYLSLALEDGRKIVDQQFGALTLRHHRIADLQLPTGRLVACDPYFSPEAKPLKIELSRGNFPVILSVADYGKDQRAAFATIRFKETAPVRWEMLTSGDKPLSSLKKGDIVGYGVDSATGSFMDASGTEIFTENWKNDDKFADSITDGIQKTFRNTWSWMEMPIGPLNLVAFSTGFGDGLYATYAGFDSQNEVAVIVTDFMVVPTEEDNVPQH